MRSLRTLALVGALVVGGVLIGTIVATRDSSNTDPAASLYRGSTPPPGIHLPAFTLPRSGGGTLSSQQTAGKIVVTTFVDSACKEKCPIIVGIIGRALPLLTHPEQTEVVALAFSVNPRVDTPARVHRFLAERGATRLVYLVGTVQAMRPLWKEFGILSAVDSGNSDVHSADVRVFDRHGEWVSTLRVGLDLTPQNLVHDIHQALKRS